MTSVEEYLNRYPKESKRLMGIEFEQFQTLIQKAEVIHQEKQKSRSRLIQAGRGRSRKLSVKQEILLTLIYLHQFPTFQQKKYYSGKKAAHTFKNQLIITPDGREIVDGLIGYPGPVSDISLWREQQHQFSQIQSFQGDKAYIGEVTISTPKKKPIKGKLTAE